MRPADDGCLPRDSRSPTGRILIVGNSVSEAHRFDGSAYPDLLERRLGDGWRTHRIIRGGATVDALAPAVEAALDGQPFTALVLQVGITECAPRPLGLTERALLGRVRPGWLQARIVRLLHDYRPQIIRARLKQFVPVPKFTLIVGRLIGRARQLGVAVLILPITSVTDMYELRSPFTNREIARYNRVLQTFAAPGITWVDQGELLGNMPVARAVVAPDEVHLSQAAHHAIADYIERWLVSTREDAGNTR